MVIAFLGRVVMEKGLDVFADAIHALRRARLKHRVLVIGEGPARPWFEQQLPDAVFIGQRPATISRARSPARTSCSIRRSPRRSATSRWRPWPARLPVVAAEATGSHQPGPRRRHRDPGRRRRHRRIRRCARGLCRDPELRRRHGEAGLAFAKTMDWDTINSAVLRVYRHAIIKRKRLERLTRIRSGDAAVHI